VGEGEFVTRASNGGHIYVYLLGSGRTPQQVAAERGNGAVLAVLEAHSSPARRLVAACWREDAIEVARLLAKHPGLAATLEPADARALPDAAGAGKLGVVNLMLEAGFDPAAPGLDQGTALHCAAWFGHAAVVERLIQVIDLSLRDGVHGSPPLGWAAHGARWCNNREGDYVRTVEALLAAGADVHAAANSGGTSMLDQAGGREDVKAVLRRYGAS
jgi:ankyrin repeat protein